MLHGRVVFPDGSGAERATVALGELTTTCDGLGRFQLELVEDPLESIAAGIPLLSRQPSLGRESALVAYLAGWTPGVLAGVGDRGRAALRARPREPLEPVEVVLAAPALSIDGTLIGRDGAPAAEWRLALLDGVPAFRGDYRPFSAEELSGGTRDHRETGRDGRFEFTGLTPERTYRVRAWNPRTLEQVTSEPLLAGTPDHVLRVPDFAVRPLVDGVVVGLDGEPLEGMRCRLSMVEYEVEGATWMTTGQEVETDALGRFAFRDVPACAVFVRIDGQDGGAHVDLAPDDPGRGLRVEVARTGAFTIEVRDPARAPDALRALDASGESLRMERDTAPGSTEGGREMDCPRDGAREWRVSERACWLVLVVAGAEHTRLPLAVRHGRTAHLRW